MFYYRNLTQQNAYTAMQLKDNSIMNVKLSRQQRRALERERKKNDQSSDTPIVFNYVYGPFEPDEAAQYESAGFTHYIRKIEDGTPLTEFETLWTSGWVHSSTILEFNGRKIPGMVYFGKPPIVTMKSGLMVKLNHFYLDPTLEIAESSTDKKFKFASQHLAYEKLIPTVRANYLDWLGTGKCDVQFDDHYMALYFLGLEWGFFQDDYIDGVEKVRIKRELYRLFEQYQFGIYGRTISLPITYFERDNLSIEKFDSENIFMREDRTYNFMIEAGVRTLTNTPLNGSHAYALLVIKRVNKIEPVREVCPYVFEKIFIEKFDLQYPNGLKISQPDLLLPNDFESEIQGFVVQSRLTFTNQNVPNISASQELLEVAIEIGEQVARELEQYSTEIESVVDKFLDYDDNENMYCPADSETRGDQIIKDWIETKLNEAEGIVVGELAYLMNFESPEFDGLKQCYRVLVAFNRLGYGIAPESALGLYRTNLNYPVYVYKFESTPEEREQSSPDYASVLLAMAIGFIYFESENGFDEHQLLAIAGRVSAKPSLNRFEVELLAANFKVMRAVPPHFSYLDVYDSTYRYFDSEFIRETLKVYVEVDKTLLTNYLEEIMLIYNKVNLDYMDIPTDLNLPPNLNAQFNEYVKNLERVESVSDDFF